MSHWRHSRGPYQRTDRPVSRVGRVCLIGLAILFAYSLSGCAGPGTGGPVAPAAVGASTTTPNPFVCPGAPA